MSRAVRAVLSLLAAAALGPVYAQEPVPEPVVEDALPEPEVEAERSGEPVIIESEAAESAAPATESSSRAAPVADPPSRVARLGLVEGEVTVAPAGTEEWAEAALNRPLTSGDRVWVEKDGRAELQIGSAAIYLDGDTGFGFIELDDGVMQTSLTEGAATVRIRRLAEGETVQVETPHSTVYLNRVGEYHLEVDKEGDRTIVKTRHGEAEVKGDKEKFVVRDNERGVFSGMENLTGRIESLGARTAFESWANDRDGRNERYESAKYVSRDVIGYEDLDDNGEWVSEPEYGYVWRPTYVVAGWAPYRYGRWAYVSPWGWSWIDDARWGFAPSHYGRWAYLRSRWCWVPGPRHIRPVYAPALVGWVGGPSVGVSLSFGNVGWYPLAPHDYYYPGYRHTPRYGRFVNVSNTIIVNNNYFYGGRRIPHPRFDRDRHGSGVTAISRDHFVGGRRIGDHMVRFNDNEMRQWRGVREPPAIAPYRESVLAGQARRAPPDANRFRETRRGGDYFAGRVPFHTERRAIESNGGRPIGRSELRGNGNPKDRGDFFAGRPGGGSDSEIKRAARERAAGGASFGSRERDNNRPARVLDNNSVREWQNRTGGDRERERSRGSSPVPRSRFLDNDRDSSEVARAQQSRRDDLRRNHMESPPANAFQQRDNDRSPSNGFQQRDNDRFRPRTESRDSSRFNDPSRFNTTPGNRAESRPWSQPRSQPQPRNEPRRDYSPPPRVQSQPRSEPRGSQPVARPSSQPRSESRSSGDRGRHSGSRPMNQPR
ncbi:MAG: DUF6600 domain-containing protein [Steroidobacter sp.]